MQISKLLVGLFGISAVLPSFAGDRFWTGTSGNAKWNTAGNWKDSLRPSDKNWDNVYLYAYSLVDGKMINDMGSLALNALNVRGTDPVVLDSDKPIILWATGNFLNSQKTSSFTYNGDLQKTKGGGTIYVRDGDLTLNGGFSLDAESEVAVDLGTKGKTVVFNGPINGSGATMTLKAVDQSAVYFNDKVTLSRIRTAQDYKTGVPHFCAAGSEIGVLEQGYFITYLDVENALSTNTVITWSTYRENADNSGRIKLYGAQQANRLVDEDIDISKTPKADRIGQNDLSVNTSLTLYGSTNALCMAQIDDDISIIWNPSGDYVQEFRDRAHTTTGDLIVSNGTLRISGAGTFNSVKKVFAAGGTFEVASTKTALAGLESVEVGVAGRFRIATSANPLTSKQTDVIVSGSGVLEIPGNMSLSVKTLKVDGVEFQEGLYGRRGNSAGVTEVDWIEGDGLVALCKSVPTVETVAATWDGGASDCLASSAANWEGDVKPDYVTGGLVATFASSGTDAQFDQGGVLKGIVLNSDRFTVTADETLHLRQNGLTVSGSSAETARSYVLKGSIRLDCAQSWQIQNGVTLTVNGSLNHFDVGETILLGGENKSGSKYEFVGRNVVAGRVEVRKSNLLLAGASDRPAEINGFGSEFVLYGNDSAMLSMSNAVVRKPFVLVGADAAYRLILTYGSTTNVLSGPMTAQSTSRFYLNDRSVLINEGGVKVTTGDWLVPQGSSKSCVWCIRKNPIVSNGYIEMSTVKMLVEAPQNVWKRANIGDNACMAFGCDYAVSNGTVNVLFSSATAEIDLCGHDVLTGEIALSTGINGATITSAKPGIYGFTQNSDLTLSGLQVSGAASLAKYGSGAVTFDREIASTGGLTVGEGTFTFGSNGKWANSSNIVVKGTGKLVIPASRLFNRKTVASVETADGACIELANGVNQRLASLTVNGVSLPAGTYGGASAPEGVTRSVAFSDTGSGTVTVGRQGICVIVR